MKNNVVFKSAIAAIMTISTFFIIMGFSISYNSYDINYYMNNYRENNISEKTSIKEDGLKEISLDIIKYLKEGKEEYLNNYFNEREISHMVDVFNLFQLMRTLIKIGAIFLVITIIIALKRFGLRSLLNSIIFGNISLILAMICLIGVISLNFGKSFIIFHELFFDNDLWILNPETDLMINMLTEDFFMKLGFRIALTYLTITIIIIVAAFLIKKWRCKNEKIGLSSRN